MIAIGLALFFIGVFGFPISMIVDANKCAIASVISFIAGLTLVIAGAVTFAWRYLP